LRLRQVPVAQRGSQPRLTFRLPRLGVHGVRDVRQGKHFELDVDDDVDVEILQRIAGELLANPVIEEWTVHWR
jgi:phosphoribosylformylglycinamidine synthase subunit PurS